MRKQKKARKSKKSNEEKRLKKKSKWLFPLSLVLTTLVGVLIFILLTENRQSTIFPSQPKDLTKKEENSFPNYASMEKMENQIKGKILENKEGDLILEEVFPTKRKIKIESEDFKILKLNKVVPKSNFSAAKMEEIQNEVKSTREKKADQLAKDNPDEEKIVSYNEEITKLLDEKIFELVEVKEASIEDFTVDSEITFSRLKNDDLQLTVYPAEVKIYFPE